MATARRRARFSSVASRPDSSVRRAMKRTTFRRASSGSTASTRKTRTPSTATSTSTARMPNRSSARPPATAACGCKTTTCATSTTAWKSARRSRFAGNEFVQIHSEIFSLSHPPEARSSRPQSNLHRKEGKPIIMKYLAIIAIAAAAFSLGACASKPAPASSSSSSSHGYSK